MYNHNLLLLIYIWTEKCQISKENFHEQMQWPSMLSAQDPVCPIIWNITVVSACINTVYASTKPAAVGTWNTEINNSSPVHINKGQMYSISSMDGCRLHSQVLGAPGPAHLLQDTHMHACTYARNVMSTSQRAKFTNAVCCPAMSSFYSGVKDTSFNVKTTLGTNCKTSNLERDVLHIKFCNHMYISLF